MRAQQTRAERTKYAETSLYTDVIAFLDSLQQRGAKIHVGFIGRTMQGRDVPYVIASRPLVTTPLGAMCRASGVGAEVTADAVPVISTEVFQLIGAGCVPGGSRDNLAFAANFTEWDGATPAQKADIHDAHREIYLALQERDGVRARDLLVAHLAASTAILCEGLLEHPEFIKEPDGDAAASSNIYSI